MIHEQPIEVSYDPRNGGATTRTFKGDKAAIDAQAVELMFYGYKFTKRQLNGGIWELTATISGDDSGGGQVEQDVDNWEILPNAVEKDLLLSDSDAVKNLVADDVKKLRKIMDGQLDPDGVSWTNASAGNPAGLLKVILAGGKSKTIYQQVLRHTKTIGWAYQVPASLTNVGKVYTTAALKQAESMPVIISGSLPTAAAPSRTDGVSVTAGWLKGHPTIQVSAYGKSQIVQEWHYGYWATLLYSIVS